MATQNLDVINSYQTKTVCFENIYLTLYVLVFTHTYIYTHNHGRFMLDPQVVFVLFYGHKTEESIEEKGK